MRSNIVFDTVPGFRRLGRFFETIHDLYTTQCVYQCIPTQGSALNGSVCITEVTFMAEKKRRKIVSEHLKHAYETFSTDNQATHAWDDAIADQWPALSDFLCASVGPGGEYRQGAAITLFARDGAFRLCLKDKQLKITLWAEGDCLKAAVDALEAQLRRPGAAS